MTQSINGTVSRGTLHVLSKTQDRLEETQQRLSTGQRLNQAEDDSAGLQVSNKLRAKIRALNQATENADLGRGRIGVMKGVMDSAGELLTRAAELATRAASDTLSGEERTALNEQFQGIKLELDTLNSGTAFNGEAVFGAEAGFEVFLEEDAAPVAVEGVSISAEALGLADASLLDGEGAGAALASVEEALGQLTESHSGVSASASYVEGMGAEMRSRLESLVGSDSRIRDADYAQEVMQMVRLQILSQGGLAAMAQSNHQAQSVLQLLNS